jgi:Flp pilus assembly protein TadB
VPKVYLLFTDREFKNKTGLANEKLFLDSFKRLPFPEKFKKKVLSLMNESGIGDANSWIYWIILTFIMPLLLVVFMIFRGDSLIIIFGTTCLCVVLPNIYIKSRIEKRKKAFIINAYKLYYFLHSQISSGIKVTDAIKGLHEIADDPLIYNTFVKFVAQYELTLNIESSLKILRDSFSGYDCEMLCVSIEQCVNTGMAGKTLLKMEQIMFGKYFFYLQKDTEKYRTKLLISGLFAIVPVLMLFLMPMLFDAIQGFGQIMSMR